MNNEQIEEPTELLVNQVIERLDQIPRTGWVKRGVKDPETVWEHTLSLVQLASEVGGVFKGSM